MLWHSHPTVEPIPEQRLYGFYAAGGSLGGAGILTGVQKTLQDQHGGHLIDDAATAGTSGMANGVQVPVGLGRTHPLIPEMHGKLGEFVQLCGKFAGSDRAWAFVAREMQRQADDDRIDAIAPGQSGQRAQVGADLRAMERQQGLGGLAQLVGERNANAAVAMVEAKETFGAVRRLHTADLNWKQQPLCSACGAFAPQAPTM